MAITTTLPIIANDGDGHTNHYPNKSVNIIDGWIRHTSMSR